MKLIKISKAGNLYFQMSDSRTGIVYPDSGYDRISTKYGRKLYQINTKVIVKTGDGNYGFSYRRKEYNTIKLVGMLLRFDLKNCGGLQL